MTFVSACCGFLWGLLRSYYIAAIIVGIFLMIIGIAFTECEACREGYTNTKYANHFCVNQTGEVYLPNCRVIPVTAPGWAGIGLVSSVIFGIIMEECLRACKVMKGGSVNVDDGCDGENPKMTV